MINFEPVQFDPDEWCRISTRMVSKIARVYDEQRREELDLLVKWRGWEVVKQQHFADYVLVEVDEVDRREALGFPDFGNWRDTPELGVRLYENANGNAVMRDAGVYHPLDRTES